jgi:hypothetical protein
VFIMPVLTGMVPSNFISFRGFEQSMSGWFTPHLSYSGVVGDSGPGGYVSQTVDISPASTPSVDISIEGAVGW